MSFTSDWRWPPDSLYDREWDRKIDHSWWECSTPLLQLMTRPSWSDRLACIETRVAGWTSWASRPNRIDSWSASGAGYLNHRDSFVGNNGDWFTVSGRGFPIPLMITPWHGRWLSPIVIRVTDRFFLHCILAFLSGLRRRIENVDFCFPSS